MQQFKKTGKGSGRGNRTGKGYFEIRGNEPLAKNAIGVRLPQSADTELRAIAGDDLSSWVRTAILRQLELEKASRLCQHNYLPYWQTLDALVMQCEACGAERSLSADELSAVLGCFLSVRNDYQRQALTAKKRLRREELEKAVAEKDKQIEYLKGRLGQ